MRREIFSLRQRSNEILTRLDELAQQLEAVREKARQTSSQNKAK